MTGWKVYSFSAFTDIDENQEFGQAQALPAPGQKAVIMQSLLAAVFLAEDIAISCCCPLPDLAASLSSIQLFVWGSLDLFLLK